ncbi:MAG: D-cysteine desulfhydrase family protein [Anaerolineae bacterium]|nr:D-cysteine desulfhydrase family protein [Anaerolineae bacterium]MDW8067639.1 D-cysteine desulfhydrase family protein [Anaerolineae bacterium]
MLTDRRPRVSIAHLPTPLEPLPRLTALLRGPQLWVKRDDQTGLATGGNKARKLEFLVAEALAQRADTLVTCGAAQSNHARQTAAAAARFGLACTLVLRGHPPAQAQGNLLLDGLLGAEILWAEDAPLAERMEEVAASLRARGRRPYVVPYGGSNPVGVCGYVAAMEELLAQAAREGLSFDYIVLASSSGGTQAGLAVAARALGYPGRILGVSVDLPADALRQRMAELANATADYLSLPLAFTLEDFVVEDGYLGGGYGVIGDREREAIRLLARTEGLLLDPVYTGRAFGGLMDLIRRGVFSPQERVLFWHTGGVAGLFAYPTLE